MQSKNNNDTLINYDEKTNREELLLNNKEIINSLILENNHKKDKSFISIKELEYIREYENNLLKLLADCPGDLLNEIIHETSKVEDLEMNEIKNNSNNFHDDNSNI